MILEMRLHQFHKCQDQDIVDSTVNLNQHRWMKKFFLSWKNREVNKEISQEANESARLTGEGEGQTPDTRETVAFQSSKQETKTNLLQRVEEILKEEPISDLETPEVNSSSIDYAS